MSGAVASTSTILCLPVLELVRAHSHPLSTAEKSCMRQSVLGAALRLAARALLCDLWLSVGVYCQGLHLQRWVQTA
eukprot:54430-Rhodomonas_salina.1